MTVYSPEQIDKISRMLDEEAEQFKNAVKARMGEIMSLGPSAPPQPPNTRWDLIQWKTKEGQPAGAAEDWSWGFVTDREGRISPDVQPVVDYLKRYGKAQIQGYEYTLSKNGQFFNRRRLRQA